MRRVSLIVSLLAALLLGLPGALAQADPFADAGLPELALTLTDAGIAGAPAETPAGRYLVTFTNAVSDTGDPFEDSWSVEFVMLPAGMTADDVALLFAGPPPDEGGDGTPVAEAGEAAAEASPAGEGNPSDFFYHGYLAGGPGALRGETARGVVDLLPGDYAVLAFGVGAPAAMTVAGGGPASPEAGAIDATATITETGTSGSFAFAAEGLAPGPGVLAIANDSDQPHFVFAIRSEDPITEDEVMTLLMEEDGGGGGEAASPVASPAGGGPEGVSPAFSTGTQSPDTTQYLAVDLEPGYYVLLCFVGDPNREGTPHAFEGMIAIVPVGV
jgi:hypothetical protein